MKVNSALYNPYTGIIKNISLLQNELTPDYYIIKSSVTDRKKFDTEFLFDEVGAGCSLSYEKAMLSSIGEAVQRYCGNIPMNEIIEKSKNNPQITRAIELTAQTGIVAWVDVEKDKRFGIFTRKPEREEVVIPVEERFIVELYSK